MLCKLVVHSPSISERIAHTAEPQERGMESFGQRGGQREDAMKRLSGGVGFVDVRVSSCEEEVMCVDMGVHDLKSGSRNPDIARAFTRALFNVLIYYL